MSVVTRVATSGTDLLENARQLQILEVEATALALRNDRELYEIKGRRIRINGMRTYPYAKRMGFEGFPLPGPKRQVPPRKSDFKGDEFLVKDYHVTQGHTYLYLVHDEMKGVFIVDIGHFDANLTIDILSGGR